MKFKGLLFLLFAFSLTVQSQTTKKLSQPEKDSETFWTTFGNNYALFQLTLPAYLTQA